MNDQCSECEIRKMCYLEEPEDDWTCDHYVSHDGITLRIGEGGKASLYDDTYDITIHCETKEEQDEVKRALQNVPHWIPVTKKLPGIGEPVLDDSLSINWMSYRSGGKEWVFPRDVRAWIPLPEPYKEETE